MQTTSHKFTALVILLGMLAFAGCRDRAPNQTTTATTREVVDEAGRRLVVPKRIDRIVSLAPNLTEVLYAIGAGDRLVGNTTFCNYPAEAKNVTKVGDTMQPNIERILALSPQLVLVSTASPLEAFTKQLDQHQISVYVTDPHDLEGVYRSIANVGDLVNEQTRAEQVVSDLRSRTQAVQRAVADKPRVSVFFQLSGQPLYTAGKQSFITGLIELAGGRSVTAEVNEAWPRLSDEAALASQPDAIIMLTGDSMGESANTHVAPALKNSPALKSGRVHLISGDLLTRPGPRLIDGLEQMARALHPDAFK